MIILQEGVFDMPSMKDFEQLMESSFSNEKDYNRLRIGAEFAAKLIRIRLDKNMTQEDLANKSGLKQSAIARIENNGTLPRIDTVVKIAEALGTSFDFFPSEKENNESLLPEFSSKIEMLLNCIQQMQNEILELKNIVTKKQEHQVVIHCYVPKNIEESTINGSETESM